MHDMDGNGMKDIQTIFQDPYSIIYLLPYSLDTIINSRQQKLDDLYLLKSIIALSNTALKEFLGNNIRAFDAQVGENLCQIRAYMSLQLAEKWLMNQDRSAKLSNILSQIITYEKRIDQVIYEWETAIRQFTRFNRSLDGNEDFLSFLERTELYLTLDKDIIFIISCYFLTYFNIKHENTPVAINIEFVMRDFHISKNKAKRLTRKLQIIICKLGCDFIVDIAHNLPNKKELSALLPFLSQVADESRMVLPCFTVTEIILHHCLATKIPLLFIVNRKGSIAKKSEIIYFLLVADANERRFVLVATDNHLHQYCLVVLGDMYLDQLNNEESIREYANRFIQLNPLKILLANTASHPQYSGIRLLQLRNDPFLQTPMLFNQESRLIHERNLVSLREFSRKYGCSKDKPSTFFLRHVYASIVGNEKDSLDREHGFFVHDAFHLLDTKLQ